MCPAIASVHASLRDNVDPQRRLAASVYVLVNPLNGVVSFQPPLTIPELPGSKVDEKQVVLSECDLTQSRKFLDLGAQSRIGWRLGEGGRRLQAATTPSSGISR